MVRAARAGSQCSAVAGHGDGAKASSWSMSCSACTWSATPGR